MAVNRASPRRSIPDLPFSRLDEVGTIRCILPLSLNTSASRGAKEGMDQEVQECSVAIIVPFRHNLHEELSGVANHDRCC